MVAIYWTSQANEDLKDIFDYIAKGSRKYAEWEVQKIIHATQILKHNQKSGKKVAEFAEDNIREILVGNYRIIYRIKSKSQVDILLVHHGARNLSNRDLN